MTPRASLWQQQRNDAPASDANSARKLYVLDCQDCKSDCAADVFVIRAIDFLNFSTPALVFAVAESAPRGL